ncbi:MAG TPA: GGDEF domain-containing protein, partial [Anaerolineales bacterium]|nr:GGDEF domain-containing protein [Anaerolineales bacterium]
LSQISKTVSFQMREVDVFARSGGDEFIVLLPQTNAEQAFNIAERIRLSISQRKILAGGASVNITISIGVAEMQHDPDDHSIEDIISRADKALYQSKQRGRNHTVVFSES